MAIYKITFKYLLFKFLDDDKLFHADSQTYDVTSYSSGLMYEIFEVLSLACNFTYEIHYRKDGKWGTIIESNGTYQSSSGMFDSLINGELMKCIII